MHDYEKQEEVMRKRVGEMEGKGGKSMNRMAKKAKHDTEEMQQRSRILHQLVDEGMEMHKAGDMTFEEMTEDLHKSMMAMGKKKVAQN